MQVVSQVVALETLKSSEIEEDILMLHGYGPLSTGILDLLMYQKNMSILYTDRKTSIDGKIRKCPHHFIEGL